MYLIFTEDDGWHTDQLIEAFKNNNKEVETAKINESSIIIDGDPRIIFEGKNKLLISLNNKKDILISKNSEYVFI